MTRPGVTGERLTSVTSAGANCHTDGWDFEVTSGMDWIQTQLPARGCSTTGAGSVGEWGRWACLPLPYGAAAGGEVFWRRISPMPNGMRARSASGIPS